MITKEQAIGLLQRQAEIVFDLMKRQEAISDFKKWHRDTEVVIEKVFGANTRHLVDFNEIYYSTGVKVDEYDTRRDYVNGLDRAHAVLRSFIDEINQFGLESSAVSLNPEPVEKVQRICERFHLVVRQLRERHANRPTLDVDDEYDVQYILSALLLVEFEDVRGEEWTPSYAGGSSRVDFLLKRENLIVEVKKTRAGLAARQVGEQLIIDIHKYKAHPNCETLFCFVYDPEGRVANPRGLESDLSGLHEGVNVRVLIAPSGI